MFSLFLATAQIVSARTGAMPPPGMTVWHPAAPAAGDVVISEFRWEGPGANSVDVNNEFIELYNTTDAAITVSAADGSGGWAVVADDATGTRFVLPNGTVIPAKGHFLIVNQLGYSLGNYPAGVGTTATADDTAAGPAVYTADIVPNTGIALFSTANPANFNETTRLDAVGSAGGTNTCTQAAVPTSSALYREGAGLIAYPGGVISTDHSFLRKLTSGVPQDTQNNAADFIYITVNGTLGLVSICGDYPTSILGAPGPENTTSPIQRNASIKASLLDSGQPSFASPNRVRSGVLDADEPENSVLGTFKIRRQFTNLTGAAVTRLRFRVVDITTRPDADTAPIPTADLRVLPSSSGGVTLSNGSTVPLATLTREEPPIQGQDPMLARCTYGGGVNTTLAATLAQPLADRGTINVEFNLGVVREGFFRFFVNVEALTDTPTPPPAATKAGGMRKSAGGMKLR
jgi:hypothetical protein